MTDIYALVFIAIIAIGLLIADRFLRINPMIYEGFQLGQPQRCGVDMLPCTFPTRCMNGFCRSSDLPQLYDRNPLPVTP
jgi:hypothetical protein